MDQTTTVRVVRNAADKHFLTPEKETFLTYMDNMLPDDAEMIGALTDLQVPRSSNSTTLVLQSENDEDLNFAGHSGKLWQCETCNEGYTVLQTFTKKHATGAKKYHKLLRIFAQPNTLGKSRGSGYGKPDDNQATEVKDETVKTEELEEENVEKEEKVKTQVSEDGNVEKVGNEKGEKKEKERQKGEKEMNMESLSEKVDGEIGRVSYQVKCLVYEKIVFGHILCAIGDQLISFWVTFNDKEWRKVAEIPSVDFMPNVVKTEPMILTENNNVYLKIFKKESSKIINDLSIVILNFFDTPQTDIRCVQIIKEVNPIDIVVSMKINKNTFGLFFHLRQQKGMF